MTNERQRAMIFTFDAAQQEGQAPGQPILRVRGRDGIVEVAQGASGVRVDVPGREFFWDCGLDPTNDRTNGPEGTDLVFVSRAPMPGLVYGPRHIEWKCYRKIPVVDTGTGGSPLASGPTPVSLRGIDRGEVFNWIPAEGSQRTWPLANTQLQDGWRWCSRCGTLWFSGGSAASICPNGGPHTQEGSGHYFVPHNVDGRIAGLSRSWRWCHKCQGLWNTDWPEANVCPAGGQHSSEGSGEYSLLLANPPLGSANGGLQGDWHSCLKCGVVWFAGHGDGRCAAGNGHRRPEGQGVEMLHRPM